MLGMGNGDLLSTSQVAERLGVTRQRALELITSGRLAAQKVGNSYIVKTSDVDSLKLMKVGRPSTKKSSKKGSKK